MIKKIHNIAKAIYHSTIISCIRQMACDIRFWAIFRRFTINARKRANDAKKGKHPIHVVFMMWDPALWKNESLFRKMIDNNIIEPSIWIAPLEKKSQEETQLRIQRCKDYIQGKQYTYYECATFSELRQKTKIDYIFVVQPYDFTIPFSLQEVEDVVPCYLPYAYCTLLDHALFGQSKIQWFYRCYIESDYIRQLISGYMQNKGRNLRATGLLIASQLRENIDVQVWPKESIGKFKLIWAPHWSISSLPKEHNCLNMSSFIEIADDMLHFAQKRKDIYFAFKPHPWLKEKLYLDETWGKERTDQYFETWENGENTFVANGEYVALFQQSDAMVHDSSSFIHEYLIVDKPCMFIERTNRIANFNESTLSALKCYQKGSNIAEIEDFVNRSLMGEDPMSAIRKKFVSDYYFIEGCSPEDAVINDLLNP